MGGLVNKKWLALTRENSYNLLKEIAMLVYLILLFTLVPVIELALLIKVGQYLGVGNTIGIVIFTGIFGAFLAKSQGLSLLGRIQRELEIGVMPQDSLFDGTLILCGGILLLTPGLITDFIGLMLLVPFGRALIKAWIKLKIRKTLEEGHTITFTRFRF